MSECPCGIPDNIHKKVMPTWADRCEAAEKALSQSQAECENLRLLLGKERDEFGKKETELAVSLNAWQKDFKEMTDDRDSWKAQAEKMAAWLRGLIEISDEALKVGQLGGQTSLERKILDHRARLRIDEMRRDLESYDALRDKDGKNGGMK